MKKIFSLALFSMILLSGYIGQKPALIQTETPAPAPDSNAIEIYENR